jgi:N-acetyl-alpha-D-glucosaminyl L-malate synthase BshA
VKLGIVCYPTYGGSGAVATELGQTLARRGHEVHLISYAPPFRLREFRTNLHFHAVEVSAYPLFRYPPYDLALASKIVEVAQETGLDLLHAHYALPHAISAYLARQMLPGRRIRVVTTLHGTDITLVGMEKAYYEVTRFGIWESDGVTVVSEWLRKETERIFEVGSEMRVIPNFVDTERFSPDGESSFRARLARPEEKLIVHASNFRPVKRVVDVVRVFARIREKMPARLILVGDGPDLPQAAGEAASLGVKEDVVFAGQQAALETLLKVSDLFLLPSEFESFGLSALEALSCGVPVVSTDAGGMREVVRDGRTGHLCRVGDTECMARFSVSLLGDPGRLEEFRRAARESVLESFAEEEVVTLYERFYEELIGT